MVWCFVCMSHCAWLTSHAAHYPASWLKMVCTSLCSTWRAPVTVALALALSGWYWCYNLIMPQLIVLYTVAVGCVWVSALFLYWFNYFHSPYFLADGHTFSPPNLCKLMELVGFQKCQHDLQQNSWNWKHLRWCKSWVCYNKRSAQLFDPRGSMICGHFCKRIRCITVSFIWMEHEMQDSLFLPNLFTLLAC
jgi:hypothetical protein